MYIVAYMFTNSEGVLEDAYCARESFKEAWDSYQEIVQRDGTYSANLTAVIASTDYDPAKEFANYVIAFPGQLVNMGETK